VARRRSRGVSTRHLLAPAVRVGAGARDLTSSGLLKIAQTTAARDVPTPPGASGAWSRPHIQLHRSLAGVGVRRRTASTRNAPFHDLGRQFRRAYRSKQHEVLARRSAVVSPAASSSRSPAQFLHRDDRGSHDRRACPPRATARPGDGYCMGDLARWQAHRVRWPGQCGVIEASALC
jgi:hypothetical protein